MKKHLCLAFILSTAFLAACGDSDSGSEAKEPALDETEATLGNGKVVECNDEREGVVAALADGSYRRCKDGLWVKISESEAQKAENIIGLENAKSSSSQASGAGEKPNISSSSVKPEKPVESSSSSANTKPTEISSSSVDEEPVEELYECEDGSLVENLIDCKATESSSSSSVESSADESFDYGKLTDVRDGQTYKTITIGTQTWMAENLNYNYNKGTANSYLNTEHPEYGRYYTWAAAMDSAAVFSKTGKGCGYGTTCSASGAVRGVCPAGWHLPSTEEWETLFTAVGGQDIAGKMLKSDSKLWNTLEGNTAEGTNDFGFAVLPAGRRHNYGGFYYAGSQAEFWSSSEYDNDNAYYWYFHNDKEKVLDGWNRKDHGRSIRCLKDSDEASEASSSSSQEEPTSSSGSVTDGSEYNPIANTLTDLRDTKTYKTVTIKNQVWMAENLNYNYNEGTSKSHCYDDKESNCEKYGRLYSWPAARAVCPAGWHLPSKDEWEALFSAIENQDVPGTALKSNSGWNDNGNGTDTYGFKVMPAGYCNIHANCEYEGDYAYFWTNTSNSSDKAYFKKFISYSEDIRDDWGDIDYAYSVRCLKD